MRLGHVDALNVLEVGFGRLLSEADVGRPAIRSTLAVAVVSWIEHKIFDGSFPVQHPRRIIRVRIAGSEPPELGVYLIFCDEEPWAYISWRVMMSDAHQSGGQLLGGGTRRRIHVLLAEASVGIYTDCLYGRRGEEDEEGEST